MNSLIRSQFEPCSKCLFDLLFSLVGISIRGVFEFWHVLIFFHEITNNIHTSCISVM